MGPTGYRELKRSTRKFQDGSTVMTPEGEGYLIWSRWVLKHSDWFGNVKLEDGVEKFFWHSELSACTD